MLEIILNFLAILTDVDIIKVCCDEAIVAFGGKPVHEPVTANFREESCNEIFRSPPKVEMAFKKVVKSITIGESVRQI